ncbi:aminotransferase class I/II-fold pyridoxal phosphate-dependent enzyme [Streptomyces sp. NPDC055815]
MPDDARGQVVGRAEEFVGRYDVRAVYAMPTVHNPLGWVLDREQRERLVAVARSRDCLIVEDGTYAFLDASPPPPVQALAPERTCYVAGLSKNVAPGLRFGFAVLPGPHVEGVTRSLRGAAWGAPGLVTALATGWLSDGTVTRLERERREDAAARQGNRAVGALVGLQARATGPVAGRVRRRRRDRQRPADERAARPATVSPRRSRHVGRPYAGVE